MIKPFGVDPGSAALKTFDFENRFHFITDFAFVNMKMKIIFIFVLAEYNGKQKFDGIMVI